MTENNNKPNEIDTRLLKLIGLLRPTPPRNPRAVEQGRTKFLAEVDTLIGTSENPSQKKKFYLFHPKEKTNMNAFKPKFALTTLFVIATIFVFLFGGTGLTVYAAQSALPGDALYPVKTGLEQTRLSLTSADDRVAQMNLTLAQKRLTEIEGLIQEGRFDQVAKTAAEFERHIQQMAEAIKRLAEKDPARASELASQLMSELSKYTQALAGLLSNLPEDVKMEVEKAIIGSESASGMDDSASPIEFTGVISTLSAQSWTVAGRPVAITAQTEIKGSFAAGDTVKVHARTAADGSLIALEIEVAAAVGNTNDNQNANENANANGNDNSAGNGNANGNENENSNANDNGNENENSNANENGIENENSNANENDNANDNNNGFADENKFEFKGTVQTILPDMWVVGGITVAVSSATDFRGDIAVGDQVEIYAETSPDGSLLALVIRLEDGSGSANDNGDDHGGGQGSDSNSNDNGNDHGGSNDNSNDNGGGSGGSNDNGGDDSGGGGGNDNGKDG